MPKAGATAGYVPAIGEVAVATSPLGWGMTRRIAWAAAACAALWLAVLWALS